jgi:rubredoxin
MASCSVCGAVPDPPDGDPRLTWSTEKSSDGRTRWVCADCTRRFARSIEAKLDQESW